MKLRLENIWIAPAARVATDGITPAGIIPLKVKGMLCGL